MVRKGWVVGFLAASVVHSAVALGDPPRSRVVYLDEPDEDSRPHRRRPREHSHPDSPPSGEHPLRRNEEVPPGYHLEKRSRKGLLYSGIGLAAGGYLFAALGAATVEDGAPAFIPFFGPWIWAAGDHEYSDGGHDPSGLKLGPLLIVFGGLAQAGGAILLLSSAGSSRTWVVPGRNQEARKLWFSPRVDGHGAGVSVGGAL